ncbi:MAG: LPXTG cell wall anchor domain-containing protein [Candidatus Korobacteraceae bacterium]
MNDRVIVDLPYPVMVQDKVLEPGTYTIEEPRGSGDSPVLQIFSDNGMVFQANAMTIDALNNNQTPEETTLQLHHIGNDYYLDKLWITGKNYGYEFVLPERVRDRQQEMRESVKVTGRQQRSEQAQAATPESPATQSAESVAAAGAASAEGAANSAERQADSAAGAVERGAESAANTVESGARSAAGAVEQGAQSAAGAVERGAEQAGITDQRPPAGATEERPELQATQPVPQAGQSAEAAATRTEQSADSAGNRMEQGAENAAGAVERGAESAAGAVERQAEQAGVNDRDNNDFLAQNRSMEQGAQGPQAGREASALPQTASTLPLMLVLGLGSLAGGVVARRRRK